MFDWLQSFEARATGALTIERADSRDRNIGGASTGNKGGGGGRTSGGSSGRPGGVGNVGQVNSQPTTTSYGAPIHYDNTSNPVTKGITLAAGPALNQQNVNRANMYNDAARAWNATTGRSFGNLINESAPMGFSMEPPDISRPATFSGGDYHLGVNPAKLAGSILGPYGSSLVLGPLAGKAYTAMGGQDVMLGGPGAMGMPSWNGTPNAPGSPAQSPTQSPTSNGPMGRGTAGGSPMVAFGGQQAQAPGGAAFGAQPAAAPAAAPNGFFSPQQPNHTLPQGYQSAFPNSLSEQDKAMLYAKALGGMG